MKAYVLVTSQVLDPGGIPAVKVAVESAVLAFGGRYIVRGQNASFSINDTAAVSPSIISILEFPDMKTVEKWYGSREYNAAAIAQAGILDVQMTFLDGHEVGESQ